MSAHTAAGSPPGCAVTPRLSPASFRRYRLDAIFVGRKWDAQIFDRSAIADRALLVAREDWQELTAATSALYAETLEVERRLHELARGDATTRFLPRRAWNRLRALPPQAFDDRARLMRFDFHPTEEGWRLSEVNSDVPGGLNEASSFHRLWPEPTAGWQVTGDPARAYIAHAIGKFGLRAGARVGLVHATAYSDDWQQMALFQEILGAAGIEAAGLAPTDVELRAGGMHAAGRPLDAALRFFPGDWLLFSRAGSAWFERHPENLSNPLGALYSQNKFFPVACAALGIETPTWARYLPRTFRLALADLRGSRDLAKPCFGRVGEDISVLDELGGRARLGIALDLLLGRGLWIRQEAFRGLNLGSAAEPIRACVGVYCVGGKVIGGYGRLTGERFVDMRATDSPVFVVN
jgi:glutathionylspermidine synthase